MIDSTTIRLFSDLLKGVGRNPKGDGKKKGGLKVHMLDVSELLRSTNRSYQTSRGSPQDTMQLNLVFEEEKEGGHFEI